jgi:hypothetical protein
MGDKYAGQEGANLMPGWRSSLSGTCSRIPRIDQYLDLGGFIGGFAKPYGLDAFVVEVEILHEVIARSFRAGFGEQVIRVRIAFCFRRGHHGEAEWISL